MIFYLIATRSLPLNSIKVITVKSSLKFLFPPPETLLDVGSLNILKYGIKFRLISPLQTCLIKRIHRYIFFYTDLLPISALSYNEFMDSLPTSNSPARNVSKLYSGGEMYKISMSHHSLSQHQWDTSSLTWLHSTLLLLWLWFYATIRLCVVWKYLTFTVVGILQTTLRLNCDTLLRVFINKVKWGWCDDALSRHQQPPVPEGDLRMAGLWLA